MSSLFDDAFKDLKFGTSSAGVSTGIATPQDLLFGNQDINPLGSPLDLTGLNLPEIPGIPKIGALGKGGLFGTGIATDDARMALAGLGTLGNLWAAFQANSLAKKQFNFQKQFAEKNYQNQIASYNTALEDRSRSRAAVEDQSAAEAKAYIDKNRLG